MVQTWGRVWVVCGVGWVRAGERVARESDVFFGYGGASGSGLGEGVSAGLCVGASGGNRVSNTANAR